MEEIIGLSAEYSSIANKAINELFAENVNTDLEYLILPEVTKDKPVALIAIFLMMLTFGMLVIAVLVFEIVRKNAVGFVAFLFASRKGRYSIIFKRVIG